ncbi:MAG TPA: YegS/Rv2252/BmrU family lipid kinase [Firmicutes bacterium]|nr:YegS/Rv2252/BmrU family lipid kinase [Bacillota bacterium]
MGKVLLIYNPVAGTGSFNNIFDAIVERVQKKEAGVLVLRTPFREEHIFKLLEQEIKSILVAGGDGTLSHVVNALLKSERRVPLYLFPTGTVNDFAVNTGILSVEDALNLWEQGKTFAVDVGKIGGSYFINVASGGLFTDIAHKVEQRRKNNLGKIAYYLRGLAQIPALKGIDIRLEAGGKTVFSGEAYLYLFLNGRSAGSLKHLAPCASINDGLLDCLIFKKCSTAALCQLFIKVLKGRHLDDKNVFHCRSSSFILQSASIIETDIDGEPGPPLPWKVEAVPGAVLFASNR